MTTSRIVSIVLALSVGGLLLVSAPSAALAAPGGGETSQDPFAEKVAALRRKAAELRAAGQTDDAERIEKEARAIEEKASAAKAGDAERSVLKQRIAELQERAAKAKAEGRRDEAEDAGRQAEELLRKMKGDKPKPEGGAGGWSGSDADLARAAEELRTKARALRESGSVEDAEHLEGKAARLEKTLALRRESNDAERRAKEAKAAGRESEARDLAEQSGRLWRESEQVLGTAPGAAAAKSKGAPRDPLLEGSVDDVNGRIAGLRNAAKSLRDSGLKDEAAKMDERAAGLERGLRERADAEKSKQSDVEAMKSELEKLRRRMAEIEEEIRRREQK